MRKKMTGEDVLRLMCESYTAALNEEEVAQTQQYKNLLDFSPRLEGGKLVLYINIHDQNMFGALKNLATGITRETAEKQAKKLGRELTFEEIRAIGDSYTTGVQKDENGKVDTEWIRMNICPTNRLSDIFDENGQVVDSESYRLVVKKLWAILKKLEAFNFHVDEEQVKNMFDTIFYYGKNLPSKEKLADIKAGVDDLFFKVCNTLGEEETKKLLNTIQFSKDEVVADYQLHLNNKLRIIVQAEKYDAQGANQLNTISYFATQRQWAKMGRQVVDFSFPYYLDVFHGGRGNEKAEQDELDKMGKVRTSGGRARQAMNKLTNKVVYGRTGFGYHTFYDVSATRPVSGVEDKFITEPGMVNNMTGELNDKAMAEIEAMGLGDNDNAERTDQLNKMFGTTNYEQVDATYKATCVALGHKPIFNGGEDIQSEIAETGKMIEDELMKWATQKSGGGIAKADNYRPLVQIGRIIIQSIIGLPMDNTKGLKISDEYKEMAVSMQPIVNKISKSILDAKRDIMLKQKQSVGVNEMINIYSPLFVFEETFNKALNILTEYAKL